MAPLTIAERPVAELKPYPRNARTHSKRQIRQIAESIKTFGFTNPVLIDPSGMIIAGHGRVEAAKLLKMASVPCIRFDHMSEDQIRAYVLADNKLALNAGWDEEILAIELRALSEANLSFDMGVIGFSMAEIDLLVDGLAPEEAGDPEDERLPPLEERAVTKSGDLWLLGPHRLLCGDATDPCSLERLMDGEKAQMVFTDPPYNVPIEGHVSGLGAVQHREFAMASGEMSSEAFAGFLKTVFGHMADHSADGAIHFICMDWRHIGEMLKAGESVYSELKNLIVWAKDNAGMGAFYRSRHELIFAFKVGTGPHLNSFELGQHGRYRTNVWQYRGANSFGKDRMAELLLHPTVKPVAMIADAVKDVSARKGIVLDCFGGSGSTLIAAHKTGRRAFLLEIDPLYADRTIRRWQAFAHEDAVNSRTGDTYDEAMHHQMVGGMDSQPIAPELA